MRVIAGTHRSRKLDTLDGDATRPTSDKIKGAIFSKIGPYFDGGAVLDLFSGSGSIALEAISRGMDKAYCIDASSKACKVIQTNVRLLKEDSKVTILQKKAQDAITILESKGEKFDFIYMDPPYALDHQQEILYQVMDANLLSDEGYIVVESLKEVTFDVRETYEIVKEANYGITCIRYITRR